MGNACGCGDDQPLDPRDRPDAKPDAEELRRQQELAEALAGMNVEPFDLNRELMNGELNEV